MSDVHADEVTQQTIETARRWWDAARAVPVQGPAARLAEVLRDPRGLEFARDFADRVVRPEDDRAAASALDSLSRRTPALLPWHLRAAISFGGGFGPIAPKPIMPVARRTLRHMVGHLLVDAPPEKLGQTLAGLRGDGVRLDLTAWGPVVSGPTQAERRVAAVRALIERPDVERVTTTVRELVGPTSPWAFDETSDLAVSRLEPLFELAASTGTLVTLGVDRHADVDLTIDVFTRLLDRPGLESVTAGMVIQSYVPEALDSLRLLTDWARARVDRGGAPISVRLVKGGSRRAEVVDARLHDWPVVTFEAKHETDASHLRLVDFALRPENAAVVRVGLAGHDVFDLARAVTVARRHATDHLLDVEMWLGSAPGLAEAVRSDLGSLVLQVPVIHPGEFDSAVRHLVGRLDALADPEGFLSSTLDVDHEAAFAREARRHDRAVATVNELSSLPRRRQDRSGPLDEGPDHVVDFVAEGDTDPSLDGNRRWARGVLGRARRSVAGVETADAAPSLAAGALEDGALETIMTRASAAGAAWAGRDPETRAELLDLAGRELALRRSRLVEVSISESGSTLSEADHEVGAAVDSAHRSAVLTRALASVDTAVHRPPRLTVVVPDLVTPAASTVESVLAAFGAGSAVVVQLPRRRRRTVAVVAEALWAVGVPDSLLALVAADEPDDELSLLTHPAVDRVVAHRPIEAAVSLRSARTDLDLAVRTPGVTSLVVTPSADLELAAADVVASVVDHAGRGHGALDLVLAVGSVGHGETFRRLLREAFEAVVVGPADAVATVMGPLDAPPTGSELEVLTVLGPGESWLVEPRPLDETGTLCSPGVRDGVDPEGAFASRPHRVPVVGFVVVETLAEAVAVQNAESGGDVAGLHSLDVDEIDEWLHAVRAGDLVVGGPTTGARVRRRPTGGWGRRAIGRGLKPGGPNALIGQGAWHHRAHDPRPSLRLHDVSEGVTRLVDAARPTLSFEQFDSLRTAVESDQRAWQSEFGLARDVTGLVVERNVLRYRPHPVTVRLSSGADRAALVRLVAAGARAGSTLIISSAVPLPAGLVHLLRASSSPVRVRDIVVESDEAFVARAAAGALQRDRTEANGPDVLDLLAEAAGGERARDEDEQVDDSRPAPSPEAVRAYRGLRIRLVGGDPAALARAVQGSPDVTIVAGEVTEEGRIELLTFVREQSVSLTAHRYGRLDPALADLRL
ncbi:proline dehydrogenase family protein [Frigoribacterium sp. VKM Ac-2836]|uniref:proline dehydrogenase family protein n=1 Tax=Frigoribacterium sp. VKM Ac-2836 TaxID=2739014 RepID=UPI0015641DEC|nr:proline dehydrogenase family protein [Frigoribacterium sp. VKM Ac-2836]NRD26457.1 proline dehydrogenase family protein [Frigoribacterium sp. VKM Ac-2836]